MRELLRDTSYLVYTSDTKYRFFFQLLVSFGSFVAAFSYPVSCTCCTTLVRCDEVSQQSVPTELSRMKKLVSTDTGCTDVEYKDRLNAKTTQHTHLSRNDACVHSSGLVHGLFVIAYMYGRRLYPLQCTLCVFCVVLW